MRAGGGSSGGPGGRPPFNKGGNFPRKPFNNNNGGPNGSFGQNENKENNYVPKMPKVFNKKANPQI